jgi:pyruvate formate lyase activating enzyme
MSQALFFEREKNDKVRCRLCPHNCLIAPDKSGFCGVRKNVGGTLESLVYGKASSAAVDPIEKKPLFHFKPASLVFSMGTLGCNMHCGHCQNWNISHVVLAESPKDCRIFEIGVEKPTEYISPERAVELAIEHDCDGIAWTYNEPTVWFEYTLDTAKLAKEKGLYTVYVTNGYINPDPLDMIGPYLDAYRVDVKAFSAEAYKKLAKVADFKPVLESAVRAKRKWGMHVEIVTNIIPSLNDDPEQLKGIASWIFDELGPDTPWHVTRFTPCLEYKDLPQTPEETLEKAYEIGKNRGLKFVYLGNVPMHGFENTYCPQCGALIIERQGFDIMSYNIEHGRCAYCSSELPGFVF